MFGTTATNVAFFVPPYVAMYNRQNADHAHPGIIFDAGWYVWWDGDDFATPYDCYEDAAEAAAEYAGEEF